MENIILLNFRKYIIVKTEELKSEFASFFETKMNEHSFNREVHYVTQHS